MTFTTRTWGALKWLVAGTVMLMAAGRPIHAAGDSIRSDRCESLKAYVVSTYKGDSVSAFDSIGLLSECPAEVVELAPGLWKNFKDDSVYVKNVLAATSVVKDMRNMELVREIWSDSTAPVIARMAAYHVMLSYFQGSLSFPETIHWRPATARDSMDKGLMEDRKRKWQITSSSVSGGPPIKQVDAGSAINDSTFREMFKLLLKRRVDEFFPDAKGRYKSYLHERLYFHMKGTYAHNFGRRPSLF